MRLALVWLLYMAGFGLYFPYWSRYLTENAGLGAGEAGIVIGMLSLMGRSAASPPPSRSSTSRASCTGSPWAGS